uniref:Tox-SGS domain-containing protein n=1 Tax=Anopheles stephensi TaxID=30069 RepID=A0A182YMR5_ANOST
MDASAKFYSLQLPGKPLAKIPPGSTVEVKRGSPTAKTFFVRNNRVLLIYEQANGDWTEVHKDDHFFSVPNDDCNYPWTVYEGDLLAVRKTKGIVMYRWDKRALNQLLVASKYHDQYGYGLRNSTIVFGKMYPSEQYVGVLSRLPDSTVEFSSMNPSEPGRPVRALKKRLNLDALWQDPASSISLVERYDNSTQLSIAVRTGTELKLFRFNKKYELKTLTTVEDFLPYDNEYDRILFAKFDNGKINDLLLFTTLGLTMYRLNEKSGLFQKVYYSTAFAKLRGWNKRTIDTIATIDIDGDSRDELIASGPKGLCVYRAVFTDDGFDLVNIFDNRLEDRVVRYGLPKLTTKSVQSEGYKILLFTGDSFLEVHTKPFTPQTFDVALVQPPVAKPKPSVPLVVPQKRYIVWLHDQLDLHSMLQPLNPHAGRMELSIPLIELPNAFGRGAKNSDFLQDHDYAVLKNNNRIMLKRQPAWDSVHHWAFVIEGYKQARIKYFPNAERWEFTMEDRTFVYGTWNQLSKMRQEMVCSTWPLCGSGSAKEKALPSRWYLVHEETDYGSYANYYYEAFVEGKGDRLKRIELDSGSSVSLQYTDKHQLASFTVNTTCYEQNVSFEYAGNLLMHIKQEDRTLFQFEYRDQRMSKIVYPNKLETRLEYTDKELDRTRFEELVPVDLSPTLYYGPDYTVILDKEYADDRLVISIRNLLGGTDGAKVIKEKLHFGQPGIKSHTIHALEDMLVVVLLYSTRKEVTILQFTDKDWVEKEYHADFPLDGTISVGKKFVVVYNLKTVRVLTVDLDGKLASKNIKQSVHPNFLIHTFANGFVMYDPTDITVWTMGLKNQWQTTYTSPPTNVFSDIERVLDGFELEAEFRTALRKGFLADAITVYQNAIVLRVPALVDKTLELKVHFLILNFRGSPQFVSKQSERIPIADFDTYEYDLPTKDGDVFKLYYVKRNQKLILQMKSMRGPLYTSLMKQQQKSYKQIDDSGESAAKKKQYKKEVDEKIAEEVENISKTVISKVQFAMDLSQFGVLMNQHGVVTGNVQLSFAGQAWHKQPISPETMRMELVNQTLGNGFILGKFNYADTFKVYEMPNNVIVYDSQTNNPQEIQIVAPRYIQAQPAGKPLSMFFFPTKETVQLKAFNETMVRASNTIALVTVRHVNETSKFVIFRPVDSFLLKQTTLFTKQYVRLSQDETRTSAYIYDMQDAHLSSDGAMFYRVKVIPGGNKDQFGWYEQSINATTGETTKKSFASDGTDVTVRVKEKRERSEVRDYEGTIWDKNRQQKVVDLGALKLVDEVASYYGFEPYEQNRFGVDKKWTFDEKNVQTEWGNHYLRIPNGSTMQASFTPRQPKNLWIVSLWVRLEQVPNVDHELKIVSVDLVDLKTNSRQKLRGAKVQHITLTWAYVEMIVDTTKHADGSKLRFDISIEPSDGGPSIDIDHVRFSPLDLNFLANVYTPVNAEVRATLHNNGRLKQSLYGPNGRRVALISQDGQVMDFAMHSKMAYVASVDAKQSLVELKPNAGVYETFDTALWTASGKEWSISYGELKYNASDAGKRGEIVRKFDQPYESLALRFLYNYSTDSSKLEFSWNGQEFAVICPKGPSCNRPPKAGEVLIFITAQRISVWVEGHLHREALLKPKPDTAKQNEFRLLPTGPIEFSEFLAMYDSRVKVTYYNRMGRPSQLIVYDDPSTVRMRELVYDEIDRPIMQTKWTKLTMKSKEYFAFNENFITQVHGTTHVMTGMVSKANPSCEGFPYSRTIYAKDPTENKQYQGLPGKDYNVLSKYKRRYAMRTEIALLANIFPETHGFRQKIVERPGGAIRATVEDRRGNKVAKYCRVGNFEHRLTTYEYSDTYGHLVRVLPPQYHALAKTASRTRPFLTGADTPEEIQLQNQWKVSYTYDNGMLIAKHVPDGGNFEYVYTESGILRFSIHYKLPERQQLDRVVHFTYASDGKVMREALVNLTREQCYQLAEANEVPASDDLIESFYGEIETNPDVRYRSQQSTRKIGNTQMMESLIYNEQEKVIKKVFVVPTINTTYSIDYEYENGKLHSLQYPMNTTTSPFTLIYDYNGSGEVKSVREITRRDPMFWSNESRSIGHAALQSTVSRRAEARYNPHYFMRPI